MSAEWELNLDGNAERKADQIAGSFQKLQRTADKMGGRFGETASRLDDMGSKATGASGGLADIGSSFKGMLGGAAIIGTITIALGAALTAAKAAAAAVAKFAGAVLQGADTANQIRGVASILGKGIPNAGEKALDATLDLAKKTAAPLDELAERLGKLTLAGFSDTTAKRIAEIATNIQAAGGEGEIFLDKLRDLRKEGEASASILEDLSETLGGTAKFSKALAKQLGVTTDQIIDANGVWKVKELQKIPGANKAIEKTALKLGSSYDGLAKAATPAIERLKSLGKVAFIEIGRKLKLGSLLDPLEKALASPQFKRLLNALGNDINRVFGLFKTAGKSVMTALKPYVPELKKIGKAVASAFGSSSSDTFKSLSQAAKVAGPIIAKVVVHVIRIAAGLALLVAAGLKGAAALAGFAAKVQAGIQAVVAKVKAMVTDFSSGAKSAASGLISGLVNGIKAGVGAVGAAIKALGSSAIAEMKNVFKQKSPSKVFYDIGGHNVQGFTNALHHGQSDVQNATQSTFNPKALEQDVAKGAGRLGGASSGTGGTTTVNVTVQPTPGVTEGEARQYGKYIGEEIRRALQPLQ